ncbi:MAG: YfhO family protein [Rikenellaceae bacterium]
MKRALAIAVTLYFTLVFALFAPQIAGETLHQSDIIQYRGMAQEIFQTREAVDQDPQWSGALFGGMPAYFINVKYPAQILKNGFNALYENLIGSPAAMLILAMLSMWIMLVMMKIDPYVAIVGGAIYGLSTYFFIIIGVGHVTKMWALVYAPAMIGAIDATLKAPKGKILLPASLAALFASLEIGANHPQISYYFFIAILFLWAAELIAAYKANDIKEFAKKTGILAVAALFALISNLSPLYYTLKHTSDTMRGGSELTQNSKNSGLDIQYATAWSYGKGETLNLLIPDFMGRDSATPFSQNGAVADTLAPYGAESIAQQLPTYWGTQPFTAGSTYLGAVAIFLAALGIIYASKRQRRWIIALTILMTMLAWGSNLMWLTELFFKIVPLYNKFRTVSMALVVVEWTIPLLATIGLYNIFKSDFTNSLEEQKKALKNVAIATGATAGVAALLAIGVASIIFSFGYEDAAAMLLQAQFPYDLAHQVAQAMADERESIMAADAWRTVIYILIAAATIAIYIKGYIKRYAMLAIVGAAAIIDLTGVSTRYLNHSHFGPERRNRIVATAADREIHQDKGETGNAEFRVLNLSVNPFNDATTSYHHRSVGGYHGAKLARYQDIIDFYLHDADPAILDMLNTKYLIVPTGDERQRKVITRNTRNGAAWFVDRVVVAQTPLEAIETLAKVNLKTTAVVEQADSEKANIDRSQSRSYSDKIAMEQYLPHYQKYNYTTAEARTAIFSEIYFDKGWRAFIDGEEVSYFRANYILRAINLPAGEHTIEWKFKSPNWIIIEAITLIASLTILFALAFALYKALQDHRQNKKKKCDQCDGTKCKKCKRKEEIK